MASKAEMRVQATRTAERFALALMGGDAGVASRLFSEEGTCLSRDGTEIRGRPQIAALLAQVVDSEHRLTVRLGRTLVSGEVAFSTQFWTRRSESRRREGFEAQSTARLVLGRGEEGWEVLIASLWE